MKPVKWTRLQLFSFLAPLPFVVAMLHLIMYEHRAWSEPRIWLFSTPLIFLGAFLSFNAHISYDNFVERKYPSLNQTKQRILAKALVTVFVMTPSVYVIFLAYHYFGIFGYQLQGAVMGLSVNIIFETLFEADYIFRKYKENAAENESLLKLSVNQEFDTLKSRVNPHFLFNCFNTLSSLIGIDKAKALQFLDELSKVYRYLLRTNQESLCTLQTELNFIDSYFTLLKTRHGESIQLRKNIDKQYLNYFIPSLTLQLVVENAVKHNAISKSNPLVIDIFTAGENKLVVNNNLQRRASVAQNNGVGLANIKMKYQLLEQQGFQVMEGGRNFTVVLPLLWKPDVS
jgi:two-component system, LytTR family, sensor kinase